MGVSLAYVASQLVQPAPTETLFATAKTEQISGKAPDDLLGSRRTDGGYRSAGYAVERQSGVRNQESGVRSLRFSVVTPDS